MLCPACYHELKELNLKNLIIDVCDNCNGIWFDKGELVDYVNKLIVTKNISPTINKLFQQTNQPQQNDKNKQIRMCPKCNIKLQSFNYAYNSNIFLDKCSSCEGLWTDKNEALQIAKILKKDKRLNSIGAQLIKDNKCSEQIIELSNILSQRVGATGILIPNFFLAKIIIETFINSKYKTTPIYLIIIALFIFIIIPIIVVILILK